MKNLKANKRRYLHRDGDSLKRSRKRVFVVFWNEVDAASRQPTSDGPYSVEGDAHKIMNEHLANGTCSWVVSYNG